MQLVIFDIDGTLTNTNEVDAMCFINAFAQEFYISDININWQEYLSVTDAGITNQIFQEKWGRLPSRDEISRFKRRFVNLLEIASSQTPNLFDEIPGAANAISKLQLDPDWCVANAQSARFAIATGGWYDYAILKLQKANIITGIPLASADDGITREDIIKIAILKAKNFYKVEFKRIVFIGDGIWDLKTAVKLGIPFIGRDETRKLINIGVKDVISDFKDLNRFKEILATAKVPTMNS